jgi:hypothetical protein
MFAVEVNNLSDSQVFTDVCRVHVNAYINQCYSLNPPCCFFRGRDDRRDGGKSVVWLCSGRCQDIGGEQDRSPAAFNTAKRCATIEPAVAVAVTVTRCISIPSTRARRC